MTAAAPRDPVSSGRSLMVDAGRDGHFAVQSQVNGVFTDFMSIPAPRWWCCARPTPPMPACVRCRPTIPPTVSTANGKVKAAPVKIDRIEVGGITVYDVPAMVLPDDILDKNLLGMAFLSRLKRYEVAGGRLVMEQ